ncbi:MAG: SRPBCC family protein [Pseudonocardiaceae bacterium]
MTAHDDGRRSISLEVEVPGTPEQVWEAIATGPGISAWFVPSQVDEREGGDVIFHLGPDMDAAGTVTGWRPPERFAYEEEWAAAADTGSTTLATEFLVEARSGGTCIVRLVSTFSAEGFDDDLDGMSSGWTAFLDNLRLYLTHFRGRPSVAVSLAGASPDAKAVAWTAMLDALGLTAPVVGGRVATDEASGAPALRGVVERAGDEELLIRTPDALASLAAFEWDGRTTTVFRAACFGPDPEALAAREAEVWGAWMHQHFPSQPTAVEARGS